MGGQKKHFNANEQQNAVRRMSLRKKVGEIREYRISAVDIAIFAAAFAVLYDKSTGASDAIFRKILKDNKLSKVELEDILIQVNSASAEALAFSGLLSTLREDLVKEADKSYAESYLIKEGSSTQFDSLKYDDEADILELSDILGTSDTNLPINSSVEDSPKPEKSYSEEMMKMQKASEEFTEVMRELFASELETLIAENKVNIDADKPTETPDVLEIAAEDGGWNPSSLLGLLGLAGGGGGGGGLLSAVGSGAAGRLFSGFGIDGYVSGATVFWDIDGDFIQDSNETVQTTTDSSGFYQLSGVSAGVGQIVIKSDGVDTNTGGSVGMMAASTNVEDNENAHITPLTLLKSQGISDEAISNALGVTVDIDSYNPMSILEGSSDDSELETAGTVLLKAQQLFSVVNSVSGLAEESGLSAAEALSQTVSVIAGENLDDLVGTDGGDETVIANIITAVAPDFASVAATAAASLKNVNQVLGESLANPKNALGEDARAAALITQDDLVTSFREIGKLDPRIASTEISSKLSSFGNVNDIKTNYQDIYKATIQAQADAQGGIITGVDSITVKAGNGQLVPVSDILLNDVNNGAGELKIVAIEPTGLVYNTTEATTSTEERAGLAEEDPLIQQTIYHLDLPNTLSFDDYVKVKLGPFTIIERVGNADSPEQIASRIANRFSDAQDDETPFIIVNVDGSSLSIERTDGDELTAQLQIANDNSAIDAKIVLEDGVEYISIDSATALSTNLRYIVANDAGQGHGNIRLTIEPDFRSILQNPGGANSVNEDSLFALEEQIVFSGIASAGVSEKLFVKLDSIDGSAGDFKLKIDGNSQIISLNTPQEIPLSLLSESYIVQPENFHGNFGISFDLIGSFQTFSSRSSVDAQIIEVNPVAETAELQAVAKLILGDVESDLNGSVIPVVAGEPTDSQKVKLKLLGGDNQETHAIQFNGIPDGLSVFVNEIEKTSNFGIVTIDEASVGNELVVEFRATSALIDSSFGLYSDVSAVVIGTDDNASAPGNEISFDFDIGGAYGLNVASQALTISQEDVAAALAGLDVTSIEDGATVKVKIVIDDPTPNIADSLPQIGELIGSSFVPLSGSNISITENSNNVTYEISSTEPLNVLDGLRILHPSPNFKGSININAEIIALVNGVETASVLKGPLTVNFTAVADDVTYTQPSTNLSSDEDTSIDIKPLFYDGATSLASSSDSEEEIIYVVQNIPSGMRLIDGESLKDDLGVMKTGDALKVAILTATSIGRVVGDSIELTTVEATRAHIVGLSDASKSGVINVSAYSKELSNSQTSALAGNYSINIAINPVADAPYLSADSKIRGLVDDNLSAELASKANIKIPASAALVDTDGSEALFVKITPQNGLITDFQFSGAAYHSSVNNDYLLLKASDLVNLEIKRSALNGSYDDKFLVEAIAVETSSSELVTVDSIINLSNELSAVSSVEIDVEFLQPATSPILTLSSFSFNGSETSTYDATFSLDIDKQATDTVTILVTGAPNVAGYQTKFFNTDTNTYIGAPAEVAGVWVFSYEEFVDNSGDPYQIKILLPPGYDGSGVMDFTGFSVDSLGLTNAKSTLIQQAVSQAVPNDAQVADPIVIDVLGDGLSFISENPGVTFDINSNNVDDTVGWLSGSDNAFLILLAETDSTPVLPNNGQLSGAELITEYFVNPNTTDALADLFSVDSLDSSNGDGYISKQELLAYTVDKVPYLWFDENADGIAEFSELAKTSDDFSINLNAFDDTVRVDPTGVIIAAEQAVSGGINGTFTRLDANGDETQISQSLENAKASDIFLPIAPSVSQSTKANLNKLTLSDPTIYFEDAEDGFDISSILADSAEVSWENGFGTEAWNAIQSGAKVLLTLKAKNAGTYFNLSEGARLEDEPQDTWLTMWDPISRTVDSPSGKDKFDIFLRDNFSGDIELEARATVVYTEGLTPKEVTVSRELSLNIVEQSDRPQFLLPETINAVDEGDSDVSILLPGVELAATDLSETVTLKIEPNSENPASLSELRFKGIPVSAENDGTFIVTGPINSGDLTAVVPAYASGTFSFLLSAQSQDGDADLQKIDNIPLNFSVNPQAQAPIVSTTSVLQTTSESLREFTVTFGAELVDKDGSEEISSIKIFMSGDVSSPLVTAPTFISESGLTYVFSEETSYSLDGQGLFSAYIPKTELNLTGEQYAVSGVLRTPEFFDGSINLYSEAVSVEKLDTSLKAVSTSSPISLTINPVADGFGDEGFVTSGKSTLAGDPIQLSEIINEISVIDPDETIELQISGLPLGTTLIGPNSIIVSPELDGSFLLANITEADLNEYALTTPQDQGNFSFNVNALTKDETAVSAENIRTINIASTALFEPEFVDLLGNSIEQNATFNMLEGGSGIIDFSVKLGSQLNSKNVLVEIGNVPTGFQIITSSGDSLTYNPNSGIYSLPANKLTNGLTVRVSDDASDSERNFVGSVDLNLTASTSYSLQSGNVVKSASIVSKLDITPVTDGVSFQTSISADEDIPTPLSSFLSKDDASETIQKITIAQNDVLSVKLPGEENYTSLSGGAIIISESQTTNLDSILLKAGDNVGGINTQLQLTVQTQSISGELSGEILTQSTIIPLTINKIADELVVGIGSSSGTPINDVSSLFNLIDVNTGEILSESILNDEDMTENSYLELKLDMESFSSLDRGETVSAVFTGNGVVAGSRILVGSGISTEIYEASQVSGTAYQIEIPSINADFSISEATFQVPKDNSGYGLRQISMTAKTIDGDVENESIATSQTFEIISLDPANPHMGYSDSLNVDDFQASVLKTEGLLLSNIVRVPGINESHILELVDLPSGSIIKVNDEIKPPISLHSHSKSLSAIQLSASEIDTAKIFLPENIIDGSYELEFKARVGASDGFISESGETRYNYTRMFDFSSSGNFTHHSVTAGNDLAWNSSGDINYNDGNDIVFVNEIGSGHMGGGNGEDAVIFSSVRQGNNVVIDLNKSEYFIYNKEQSVEETTENIRKIDGFEILAGSDGDDTIVGNENDTSNLTLKGGAGDDYLVGGAGDDVIFGGAGNNILAGGIGENIFIIEANNSNDQILDLSDLDKIILKGFNLNKIDDQLPSQFNVTRSNGETSDWKIIVTAINTPQEITNTILLEGSVNQFQNANELISFLSNKIEFNQNLDLVGLNPFIEELEMDVPVLDILQDASSNRDSFFGADLNFDDLSATLGVLADVKYNEALIISDNVSGINPVSGFSVAANSDSYKGMSGSVGEDTLVAGEKDSVLYGGDGGSDRLIGGAGDDIIIASGFADNGIDELTGGAGADMFSLINPSEINSTLQKIYEVRIEDFARTEGDRVVLVGYDETDTLELSSVDEASNMQTATISKSTNESLTIYFDLSFAREFDSNFTLRMADFDKIDAA